MPVRQTGAGSRQLEVIMAGASGDRFPSVWRPVPVRQGAELVHQLG